MDTARPGLKKTRTNLRPPKPVRLSEADEAALEDMNRATALPDAELIRRAIRLTARLVLSGQVKIGDIMPYESQQPSLPMAGQ